MGQDELLHNFRGLLGNDARTRIVLGIHRIKITTTQFNNRPLRRILYFSYIQMTIVQKVNKF